MDTRNVIVVSEQALLREGLRSLLKGMADIVLMGAVSSIHEAKQMAAESTADVILVDTDSDEISDPNVLSDLLESTQAQVVTITLKGRELIVYRRKRVPEASVQNLLDALREID